MSQAFLATVDGSKVRLLLELKGELVHVGSSTIESDLTVDNPTVSRRHALFRRIEKTWLIEDLGSTNGTWLNGKPVTRPTVINSGDHVSLGGARFFFWNGRPPVDGARESDRYSGRLLDRILALQPYDFEKLTGELFKRLGFDVIVTKQSADGGIDVQAVNNGVIYRGKYLIQCKRYLGHRVSRPEIVSFFGRIASEPGAKGVFITSSSFTRGAREFALATGINLIDGEELEKLASKYRLL